MGNHADSVNIHIPYAWSYADSSARTGAGGFVASDVGKFARQLDDNSIWILTAVTPTWVAVGISDASGITFTPTVLADWDYASDPGDVQEALDQLGERAADLEAAGPGGGSSLTNSNITPTTTNVTAAVGTRYFADISGLTADRNFVLPTCSAGDEIELKITVGDADYELVIIGDTGVSIEGGTAATEWGRTKKIDMFYRFVGDGSNSWRVTTIFPEYPTSPTMWHDQSKVTSGNALALSVQASQAYSHFIFQNAAADGDTFTNGFTCEDGTYTLHILGSTAGNKGQQEVYIDDALQDTIDWYSGSTVFNVDKTITSISLTAGYHTLKSVVNGKNASSSGYAVAVTKFWLEPTSF